MIPIKIVSKSKSNTKSIILNNLLNSKRIDWIDIYKGLAIILVVIGHSGSPLTRIITLFHMPAFIFISGFTFNFSKYSKIQDLVYEKFKRLIIPYFSFAFLFSGIQILLKYFNLNTIFFNTNTNELYNPFWLFNAITSINYTNPLSGATWFLIMIFESIIFSYLLFRFQQKHKINDWYLLIFIILLLIFGCSLLYPSWPMTHLNFFLDLNFISIFFFTIGYLTKKYEIFSFFKVKIGIIISILCLYLALRFNVQSVDFPDRNFDSWYKVIFSSFSGILFLYCLSNLLEKTKIIKKLLIYIGRKTLSILSLHFFAFKIAYLLLFFIGIYELQKVQLLTPATNNTIWIPIVIISVTSCLLLDKILNTNKLIKKIFLGE